MARSKSFWSARPNGVATTKQLTVSVLAIAKASYAIHCFAMAVLLANVIYNGPIVEHPHEWLPFQFALLVARHYPFTLLYHMAIAVYMLALAVVHVVLCGLVPGSLRRCAGVLLVMDTTFLVVNLVSIEEDLNVYNKSFILFVVVYLFVQYAVVPHTLFRVKRALLVANSAALAMLLYYYYKLSVDFQAHHYYNSWISLLQCWFMVSFAFFNYSMHPALSSVTISAVNVALLDKKNMV